MIQSFAHKGLERFYHTGGKSGIQAKHAERLRLILSNLDQAEGPEDCAGGGGMPFKITVTDDADRQFRALPVRDQRVLEAAI